MIDPHTITPQIVKAKSPRFPGGKLYVPVVTRRCRQVFRTKTQVKEYIQKLLLRWIRLYEAKRKNNNPKIKGRTGKTYFCIRVYEHFNLGFDVEKWSVFLPLPRKRGLLIGWFESDFKLDFFMYVESY